MHQRPQLAGGWPREHLPRRKWLSGFQIPPARPPARPPAAAALKRPFHFEWAKVEKNKKQKQRGATVDLRTPNGTLIPFLGLVKGGQLGWCPLSRPLRGVKMRVKSGAYAPFANHHFQVERRLPCQLQYLISGNKELHEVAPTARVAPIGFSGNQLGRCDSCAGKLSWWTPSFLNA